MSTIATRVTDAAILAKLDELGGNVSRTAKELKVRKARVVAVNAAAGNPAEGKKQRTVFEAAEAAVLHLAGVIEGMTKRDTSEAHRLAVLYGVAVDKLLLVAGKPITIHQQQTTTTAFDFTKLSRAEMMELLRLHDKLNGVPEPLNVSDLDSPVIYCDESPDCVKPPDEDTGG